LKLRRMLFLALTVLAFSAVFAACGEAEEPVAPKAAKAAAAAAPAEKAQKVSSQSQSPSKPASALPAATAKPSRGSQAPLATPTSAPMVRSAPTAVVKTDPVFGGTLKMISRGSPPSLDRSFTNASGSGYPGEHLYERPFGWDSNLNGEPELVSDWDLTGDGLVLTLNFREARFHTGDMMTSDAVVQSLRRWFDASGGGKLATSFMVSGKDGLIKVDEDTIQFTFSEPFGVLFGAMATTGKPAMIYTEECAKVPYSTDFGSECALGTGPYYLQNWIRGDRIILERHDGYIASDKPSDGKTGEKIAYFDRIEFLEVPAVETKVASLRTGQVDVVTEVPHNFASVLDPDKNVNRVITDTGNIPTIDFNTKLSPTDNVLVRQAIQAAVNIEHVMDANAPRDFWVRCSSRYVCGTVWTSNAADEWYDQRNPDLARQLLAEAGYDGEAIVLWAPTDIQDLNATGVVVAALLESIGINVDFPAQDWATIIGRIREGTYNILADRWGLGFRGSPAFDPMLAGTFVVPFEDAEMQQIQKDFISAIEEDQKRSIVDEINVMFAQKVPTISFGMFQRIHYHQSNIRNLTLLGGGFHFYNTWRTD